MSGAAGTAGGAQGTPRSAYGALEERATLATVAVLLGLAGLSWWSTVERAGSMASMVQGFAHVGVAMPFGMGIAVFGAMWLTMMVAMMFPTIAPIVLLHRLVVRRQGGGFLSSTAFGAGYLLIWTIVGIAPLGLLLGFRHLSSGSDWVLRAGGAVIVVAGLYQFTRWKEACLRACRTPLTFLMTHDFGAGPWGSVRVGISHGLYCLGCCWALMAVLVVVGLMNLVWMAAIAVIFLAEKNWRHGVGLTKLAGAGLVAFGLAVLVHPDLLNSVAPLTHRPMMS